MLGGDLTFTSFTQKYKKIEDLSGLSDLNLTPNEGFELSQLYDLNELSDHLKYLVRINVSNNVISKLILKNFNSLHTLIAASNMISECTLVLPRLQKLILRCNMLKAMPLLIFTPDLIELDLSKNLIDKITVSDLNPVKKTLEILNISFNRINFDSVNDFISFTDGIKFYNLKEFSIQGNGFIESNKILANSYKTLLVLSLKNLIKLNGEPRTLSNDLVNEEEIKQQMLYEQNFQNKNKKAFYEHFSQVYFDKVKNEKLMELKLTPLESFLLTDIDDLSSEGSTLKKLITLNISENLLRKITLGTKESDFPSLRTFKASTNRIEEVNISNLKSLKEIDLSNNNLRSIPDFSNVKGDVKVLILSSNKITEIKFDHFLNFANLKKFKISNNLIDFKNEDFIDKEICVNFNEFREIRSIRMEENPYCKNEAIISYLFQQMSLYLYSEKKEIKLNGIPLSPIPPGQVGKLRINIEPGIDRLSKHSSEEINLKLQSSKYEETFNSLNYVLDRLIIFNGDNQVLYFDFLSDINILLEINEIIPDKDRERIIELYKEFLMKCNEFLSLNQNYETQVIKALAQLSLIPNLNVCKITLDFLKIYMGANEDKKVIVKGIIEEIIIKDLQLNNNIPFDMITSLIGFFKNTGISSSLLYRNLILNILTYIISLTEEEKAVKIQGGEAEDFLNSLNFIIEYLNDTAEDKNTLSNIQSIAQQDEDFQEEVNDNSELSEDLSIDKTDDNLIYDNVLLDGISKFEKKTNIIDLEHNSNSATLSKLKKQLNQYENLLAAGGSRDDSIFSNDVLSTIANDKLLLKMQLFSEKERKHYENIIYYYVFLNSFKSAYTYLTKIQSYFSNFKANDDFYQTQLAKFFKEIELVTALMTTYSQNRFSTNQILKSIDIRALINSLDDLISKFFDKKNESVNYEKLIAKNVFQNPTGINPELKSMIKLFFRRVPEILNCIGSLIAFLPEREFIGVIESEIVDKYYTIINHSKADPFVLVGACKLMNHVLNCEYIEKNELCATKIFTKTNCFKNLLNYIDYTKNHYRSSIDYISAIVEEKKGGSKEKQETPENPYDFGVLSSQSIFDFFIAIIDIFVSISKYHPEEGKQMHFIIDELTSASMYDILGNCLQIVHNDEIRKKAIECFYHFDHRTISNEIIVHIINIVNKYNSISEGETEYILSLIYLTLNNKLRNLLNLNETKNLAPMKLAVCAGIKFLMQNTDRNPPEIEELMQKNTLSVSLMIFLITASRFPPLYMDLFDESNQTASYLMLKKIFYQDYALFNGDLYVPIEIERTHLGLYSIVLFETIEGYNSLKPYSYPFLRIMIRIADILCNCEDNTYPLLPKDINDEFYNKMLTIANKRIIEKITNESKDFFRFRTNVFSKKERNDIPKTLRRIKPREKCEFEIVQDDIEQDSIIKYANDLYGLSHMIKKLVAQNQFKGNGFSFEDSNDSDSTEEKLPKLTLKEIVNEQLNFVMYFSNIFNFLIGKKSNLQDTNIYNDLRRKFYSQIEDSERILDIFQEYQNFGNIKTVIGAIKHFDNEIPYSSPISKIVIHRLKEKNFESYLKASNLLYYQFSFKQESLVNNMNFDNEMNLTELYGLDPKAKRREKEENVNNPHLRSLIINSFIRCIYSILISPSIEIRNDFLEMLFIDDKYKNILLYVSTQKYYSHFNFYYVISEIFKIENIKKLIEANSYDPLKTEKKNKKINAINDLIFTTKNSSEEFEKRTKYEMNIFHNLYITAIYLEREIARHKTKGLKDFLFLYTFENTIYSFLNVYLQVNFKIIDDYFRSMFIVKRLCRKQHFDFIFGLKKQLYQYKALAYNVLFEIKTKYEKLTYLLNAVGVGEIQSVSKVISSKERKVIEFMTKIELTERRMRELLAMLIVLDVKSESQIMYTILDLVNERKKLKKKFEKEGEDEEENKKEEESEKNIISQIKQITMSVKMLQLKKKIITDNRKENYIILLNTFCNVEIFSSEPKSQKKFSSNSSFYLVLNNSSIMLFSYDETNKDISFDNNFFDISISDIDSLIQYDYTRRIILQMENKDKISLLFPNNAVAILFIEKIASLHSTIKIMKSENLLKKITMIENNNKIYMGMVQDKVSKMNANTPEMIAKAKMIYYNEIKKNMDKLKSLRVNNSIEQIVFGKYSSTFKVVNNVFYNEEKKDIVYFSNYSIYFIKEHFDEMNRAIFNFYNDEVEFDPEQFWDIEANISYSAISDLTNDFNELTTEIEYKAKEVKKYSIHFGNEMDMYLYGLNFSKMSGIAIEDYAKKNKKKNTNNISLNKSSINNKSQLYRSMNNNNMTPMQTLGNNA